MSEYIFAILMPLTIINSKTFGASNFLQFVNQFPKNFNFLLHRIFQFAKVVFLIFVIF